jgi:hypothetical protein
MQERATKSERSDEVQIIGAGDSCGSSVKKSILHVNFLGKNLVWFDILDISMTNRFLQSWYCEMTFCDAMSATVASAVMRRFSRIDRHPPEHVPQIRDTKRGKHQFGEPAMFTSRTTGASLREHLTWISDKNWPMSKWAPMSSVRSFVNIYTSIGSIEQKNTKENRR